MKFFGTFAALSMAALVLASPEPFAKRQDTNGTTPTSTTSLSAALSTPSGSPTTSPSVSPSSSSNHTTTTSSDTGSLSTVTPTTGTGNSTKSGNAAVANIRPFHISAPMLTALATTAGGILFGAWVSL